MARPLSPNEESACLEYMLCGKKTTALLNSTFDTVGLTPQQLSTKATGLFNRAGVKARVGSLLEKRAMRVGVDADWVLSEAVDLYNISREVMDHKTALQALTMVGKHVDVQAFKERIEVAVVDHAATLEARIINAERVRNKIKVLN